MYTSGMTSPTAVTNITELAAGFVEQLPDIHFATRRLYAGDDHWVLESVMTAPGSGIEVDFIDVITVRDGKVARKESYLDAVTFQQQMSQATDAAATWIEAFTDGWRAPADADAFIAHFEPWLSPDIRLVQPQAPPVVGIDDFREKFVRPAFALMPDIHGTVRSWAARGDVIFIEIDLAGTLAGRPVEWTSYDKVTLRDGVAIERVANFDPTPLLEAAKANA
jgi:ketosteroid isomerase-like protein